MADVPPAPVTMYIDTMLRENEAFVRAIYEAQKEGRVREMAVYLERLTSSVTRMGKLLDLQRMCTPELPERRELRPPREQDREPEVDRTLAVMATMHAVAPANPSPFAAEAAVEPDVAAAPAPPQPAQPDVPTKRHVWTDAELSRLHAAIERDGIGRHENAALAARVGGVTSEQVRIRLRTEQRAARRRGGGAAGGTAGAVPRLAGHGRRPAARQPRRASSSSSSAAASSLTPVPASSCLLPLAPSLHSGLLQLGSHIPGAAGVGLGFGGTLGAALLPSRGLPLPDSDTLGGPTDTIM